MYGNASSKRIMFGRIFFGRYQSNGGFLQYIIVRGVIEHDVVEGTQMVNILIWSVGALAFSIEDGVYTCVQSVETVQKRKDTALEQTLSKTNFIIRAAAKKRLEGKPDMCRTYAVKNHAKGFQITCDKRPMIDLRTDGTPTEYPTPKGSFSRTAQVRSDQIVQTFDFGQATFEVIYIQTTTGFDVIKSIESSYLGAPLRVRVSYTKK